MSQGESDEDDENDHLVCLATRSTCLALSYLLLTCSNVESDGDLQKLAYKPAVCGLYTPWDDRHLQWLLGFLEEPTSSARLLRHRFPSKVGGRPVRIQKFYSSAMPSPLRRLQLFQRTASIYRTPSLYGFLKTSSSAISAFSLPILIPPCTSICLWNPYPEGGIFAVSQSWEPCLHLGCVNG